MNGRIFVNNSSVGLYPAHGAGSAKAEQRRGRRKWTAFAIAMLRTWRSYRMVAARLDVDGKAAVVRTPFIFVGNNQYIAEGFQLGGRSTARRGTAVDLRRARVRPLRDPGAAGARAHQPSRSDASLGRLQGRHGDGRAVAASRVSVALDGEIALMRTPLDYRVRPRALRVIVAGIAGE